MIGEREHQDLHQDRQRHADVAKPDLDRGEHERHGEDPGREQADDRQQVPRTAPRAGTRYQTS